MFRTVAAARRASLVGMAGAALQIGYGLLAVAFPYPAIVERQWQPLWAAVSVGMLAGIYGWFALDLARPRPVAAIGTGLAVLGLLVRIGIALVQVARPNTNVDGPVVITILMTFIGLAVLWVCTLAARRLTGWPAWTPALVLAVGLAVSALYPVDKVVHFVALGLAWGPAWMLLSYVVYRQATRSSAKTAVDTSSLGLGRPAART